MSSEEQENDISNDTNANIWIEYEDDEGRTYYYNEATQGSAWELPTDAIVQQPPADDDDIHADVDADDDVDIKEEDTTDDIHGANDVANDDYVETQENEVQETNIKEDEIATKVEKDSDAEMENSNTEESEWTRYQDDEGRDYYYNATSQETQWEKPDGFTETNTETEAGVADETFDQQENSQQARDDDAGREFTNEPGAHDGEVHTVDTGSVDTSPRQVKNEPDGDDDITSSPGAQQMLDPESSHTPESPQETHITSKHHASTPEPVIKAEGGIKIEPTSPPKDPQQTAVENAQSFLSKSDSAMEPDAPMHLLTLAQASGPEIAISTLLSSYVNQTAICGVLSKWLVDLKTANHQHSSSSHQKGTIEAFDSNKLHESNADHVRQLVEKVIAKIAKSSFSEKAQQTLLNLPKKDRQFFEEMMEHERWRRLLIDLSAEHKDSALLTLLLQSISKRGHHREIAKRITISDYFEVFHGMLASELGLLGKLAVNGGKASAGELNGSNSADTIVNDLKRQSTTTAYTYIYVIELLDELISRSKIKSKGIKGAQGLGLVRATNKWERLREDIMAHMIKPSEDSGGSSFNPLSRKRRADIALTASEIYQKQRRKTRISNGGSEGGNGSSKSDQLGYSVESGVVEALKKYSRNTTVDETLANQLLYNPYTDKALSPTTIQDQLGDLLCNHALATRYFLHSLFLKKSRSKSNEMRMKSSKLVAMSVLSAQKNLKIRGNHKGANVGDAIEVDPVASLSKMILQGSKLCEQIENVVNFVVTEDTSSNGSTSSVGVQLSNLCIKCSAVAQGFLLWARERSNNSEFANTAAYPGTAPGILSLVRIIVNHHPLLRDLAIDIALLFLDHFNSELTYQKLNGIKEQALRLLLIVSTKGLAVDVFHAVGSKLKNERSKIDAGLIRYFVAGALEIMQPPLSLGIVRSMGGMLLLPKCTEALNAVYFDSRKKQKLGAFMGYFGDSVSDERCQFARSTQNDRAITTALKSAYTFVKK